MINIMNHRTKSRLVENEKLLRAANEKVEKIIEQDFDAKKRKKLTIAFICECSDLGCKERINLHPDTYRELHEKRDQFIVKPGHQIPAVEKTLKKNRSYLLVEKPALAA